MCLTSMHRRFTMKQSRKVRCRVIGDFIGRTHLEVTCLDCLVGKVSMFFDLLRLTTLQLKVPHRARGNHESQVNSLSLHRDAVGESATEVTCM